MKMSLNSIISPRKIETYYQEHRDNYKLADQVKMRMIVLSKGEAPDGVRKRGEEILSQLKGGASFAEMATVTPKVRNARMAAKPAGKIPRT